MPDHANVLIAGGGIIGSSLAWALASRETNGVVVVDLDLTGVYASSELNAGGARATWWQPVNIESCKATLEFFREHAEHFGFRARGYLWLYDDEDFYRRALKKRKLQNDYGLEVEALRPAEVGERFPLLDRNMHEIVGATFSPFDGLLNPNAVRRWYRERAESLGVVFCNRHYITGVRTQRSSDSAGVRRRISGVEIVRVKKANLDRDELDLREILTTHSLRSDLRDEELHLSCDTLVNCLGAWSPIFELRTLRSRPGLGRTLRRHSRLQRDREPGCGVKQLVRSSLVYRSRCDAELFGGPGHGRPDRYGTVRTRGPDSPLT